MDSVTEDQAAYAPLPRIVRAFLGSYGPASISVYVYMALAADWTPGSRRGTLETSILELSRALHLSRPTVRAAIRELSFGYLCGLPSRNGRPAPPLLRIIEQTGRTQKKRFTIRILTSRELKAHPLARARARGGGGSSDPDEDALRALPGIGKILFECSSD